MVGRMCPVAVAVAVALSLATGAGCDRPAGSAERASLEAAWTFAAAITNDPADQAQCQEQVVRVWIELGELKRAEALARRIETWRRVVLLADVAREHARRGETRAAMRVLEAAQAEAAGVTDWPLDRVRAHIARARAFMGDDGPARVLLTQYAHDPATRARLQGSGVIALAAAGRWDEALALARERPADARFEDALELAAALCEATELRAVPPPRRDELLDLAWATAGEIPGWKSVDMRVEVLEHMAAAGRPTTELADKLSPIADTWLATPGGEARLVVLSRMAEVWGRLGDAARVRAIADAVGTAIEAQIQPIDRPEIWARMASGAARAGDAEAASALFGRAVEATVSLANLRPRAMAAVAIALAAARSGFDPSQIGEAWTRLQTSIHGG